METNKDIIKKIKKICEELKCKVKIDTDYNFNNLFEIAVLDNIKFVIVTQHCTDLTHTGYSFCFSRIDKRWYDDWQTTDSDNKFYNKIIDKFPLSEKEMIDTYYSVINYLQKEIKRLTKN